jgi:hypothetical protein
MPDADHWLVTIFLPPSSDDQNANAVGFAPLHLEEAEKLTFIAWEQLSVSYPFFVPDHMIAFSLA